MSAHRLPPLRFGVEIEFKGLSREAASSCIQQSGIDSAVIDRHIHETVPTWKVVSDLSISRGGEAVSPILEGEEGLRQVAQVLNALKEGGAHVDNHCGIHVHVDASSFEEHEILNVLSRTLANEEDLNLFVDSERRWNSFCRPISHFNAAAKLIRRGCSLKSLEKVTPRGLFVNIHAVVRHGTLEFRQHAGSLDSVKVCQWVRWCLHFMEASRCPDPGHQVTYFSLDFIYDVLALSEYSWKRDSWHYDRVLEVAHYLDRSVSEVESLAAEMREHGFPTYINGSFFDIENPRLFRALIEEMWELGGIRRPRCAEPTHWTAGMPASLTTHFRRIMAQNRV